MTEPTKRPTLSMNRQSTEQVKPKKEKVAKEPKPVKPPKVPYALQMLGHDEIIKGYIDNQLCITVTLLSGIEYTGVVVRGDRYAFTLLVDDIPRTILKHAMESYQPTQVEES